MIRLLLIGLLASQSPGSSSYSLCGPAREASAAFTSLVSGQQAAEFTDEQVLAAWGKLDEPTREEIIEWFRVDLEYLDTFQKTLMKHVFSEESRDASEWPMYTDPTPYDPALHAPAQPIKRKALDPDSALLKKKRKEFENRAPERKLISSWCYDYGTQSVQQMPGLLDKDRIFRNGLNGFHPGLDLAEALLEMQLDDGEWQAAASAFGHAYTDRSGNVYTGLTLYDAWASGTKMEMPDVDSLGIIHDLDDDWKSYTAPVSEGKQKKLYDAIAKHFESLHNHRGLRHALALTFFSGYPTMRDGYYPNLERLHSLWDQYNSTPADLKSKLPKASRWEGFLKTLVRKYDKSKKQRDEAEKRRDTLHNDGLWVRQTLVNIMLRAGFLK